MTTTATFDQRSDPVVRGLVTVGALVVLLAGTQIPLPGLSADRLQIIFQHQAAPGRVSIFALGVAPIVLGRAILELCRLTIPPLARWAARPEQAAQWTRLGRSLALALAGIQAYGVVLTLESVPGVADEGGLAFALGIVTTAIGATAFLIALSEVVTRRGWGDGLLILLAAPIVARAPHYLVFLYELGRVGAISPSAVFLPIVFGLIAVALLVAASLVREPGLAAFPGANLDIWPPLLATSVLGPLGATAVFLVGAGNLPQQPLALAVQIFALAGLIALFAALRARAGAAQPNRGPVTAVEILVCVGAVLFSYSFGISNEAGGLGLIFVVAAVLSCLSPSVRL